MTSHRNQSKALTAQHRQSEASPDHHCLSEAASAQQMTEAMSAFTCAINALNVNLQESLRALHERTDATNQQTANKPVTSHVANQQTTKQPVALEAKNVKSANKPATSQESNARDDAATTARQRGARKRMRRKTSEMEIRRSYQVRTQPPGAHAHIV